LKTGSNDTDVTSAGRLFHTLTPATEMAQPPTADWQKDRTSICSVYTDRYQCQCAMSATYEKWH